MFCHGQAGTRLWIFFNPTSKSTLERMGWGGLSGSARLWQPHLILIVAFTCFVLLGWEPCSCTFCSSNYSYKSINMYHFYNKWKDWVTTLSWSSSWPMIGVYTTRHWPMFHENKIFIVTDHWFILRYIW